jgi:hypothetical protein
VRLIPHGFIRVEVIVSIDEQTHVALPKLVGAPAYARPTPPVAHSPRPFDPDDLPIAAFQTDDERHLVEALPARAYAPGGGVVLAGLDGAPATNGNGRPTLQPNPFRLRTLAGRILGRD